MKAIMGPLRMAFHLASLIAILMVAMLSRAANTGSAVGHWRNEDATIEIFEDQGRLSAKIVALREPRTPEGEEKTDIHNPDPSKRNRPILGLMFMSGFTRKSDTRWENGACYDPKSGNTYSCFMELEGPEKIKVHGYIGISLLGRTVFWTRVPNNERP
jgi:uncharacterized protein (DUF2147 family)